MPHAKSMILYSKCEKIICDIDREKCFARADQELINDTNTYLTSADGAIEIGLARGSAGSGYRQHHISVIKNAIEIQLLNRQKKIKKLQK